MALILADVVENVSVLDAALGFGTYAKAAIEPLNLLDAPIGFAWVKIDNTEGTTWALVDNRQ
jgi:hypothetical protein